MRVWIESSVSWGIKKQPFILYVLLEVTLDGEKNFNGSKQELREAALVIGIDMRIVYYPGTERKSMWSRRLYGSKTVSTRDGEDCWGQFRILIV